MYGKIVEQLAQSFMLVRIGIEKCTPTPSIIDYRLQRKRVKSYCVLMLMPAQELRKLVHSYRPSHACRYN